MLETTAELASVAGGAPELVRLALQVRVRAQDLPLWVNVVLIGLELVTIGIGVFIAYTAYRGYRRNDSRPMLFIAVGFLLVLGAPTVLGTLLLAVPALQTLRVPGLGEQGGAVVVAFLVQAFEIAGFASILYALRMRP